MLERIKNQINILLPQQSKEKKFNLNKEGEKLKDNIEKLEIERTNILCSDDSQEILDTFKHLVDNNFNYSLQNLRTEIDELKEIEYIQGKNKGKDVKEFLDALPQDIKGINLNPVQLIEELKDYKISNENHKYFQNKLESFYKLDLKQKDNTIQFKSPDEYPQNLERKDNFGQNKIDDFLVKLGEELEELMEIPKEIEYEGLMLREEVKQVEEEVKEESQVLGDAQSEGESEEDESANVGEENNGTKQQNLDQPIGDKQSELADSYQQKLGLDHCKDTLNIAQTTSGHERFNEEDLQDNYSNEYSDDDVKELVFIETPLLTKLKEKYEKRDEERKQGNNIEDNSYEVLSKTDIKNEQHLDKAKKLVEKLGSQFMVDDSKKEEDFNKGLVERTQTVMSNNSNKTPSQPPMHIGEPQESNIEMSSEGEESDYNEELKQEPKPKEIPYNYEELNSEKLISD